MFPMTDKIYAKTNGILKVNKAIGKATRNSPIGVADKIKVEISGDKIID